MDSENIGKILEKMLENQIKMSENIDQIYQMCLGLYGGVKVQR